MKYVVKMNDKTFEVEVDRVSPFHQMTREEIAAQAGIAAPAPVAPVPAAAPAPAPVAPAAGPVTGIPMPVPIGQAAPAPVAAPVAPAPAAAPAPAPVAPAPAPVAPAPAPAPAAGGNDVSCPMRGTILRIAAPAGTKVATGDPVIILEAMKMETEIVSPCDGTVASVSCNVGDAVEVGQVLATIG